MSSALTLSYGEEAIGIARAASAARMPVSLSFTVETDGRLPSGQSLGDAIAEVDAATNRGPAHFMINCALLDRLPNLCVLGGCCGTDERHIQAIAAACFDTEETHA